MALPFWLGWLGWLRCGVVLSCVEHSQVLIREMCVFLGGEIWETYFWKGQVKNSKQETARRSYQYKHVISKYPFFLGTDDQSNGMMSNS